MAGAAAKSLRFNKNLASLIIAILCSAASGVLWFPGFLDGLEGWSFNLRAQSLADPEKASGDVVLILLDQKSLDWVKQTQSVSWPWPREFYSLIVDFCSAGKSAAFAMDVVFTEPSVYSVEDDLALCNSLKRSGNVVTAISLSRGRDGAGEWPQDISHNALSFEGEQDFLSKTGGRALRHSASFNIPEYDGAGAAVGCVTFDPDTDGVFRRITPVFSFQGKNVPSLGLAAWLCAQGIDRIGYRNGGITAGGRFIPLGPDGSVVLTFRGPTGTHVSYNAAEIIRSEIQRRNGEVPGISPEVFKDKYVFFGLTATGLYDLRPSPMAKNYTGVEIHATFLDNLLSASFIRQMSRGGGMFLIFVIALAAALAMIYGRTTALQVAAFSGFLVLPTALGFGLYAAGIWFPMTPALIASVLSIISSAIYNYSTEGRQKAFIKSAFRQYLSHDVIEQLLANPEKLNLGGERRIITIFFSDLQGFTAISEALSPEELTHLLNDYLSAMTDIIQHEGGTVDKYEGDAIIAFWNAPLDYEDHAIRAVRASLRCQQRLAELRPQFRQRTGKELFMRIGLNTGAAVVGNMGSRTRFDYTMLGDSVNLAARLEGVNKQFGTCTMISENTFKELKGEFAARELSRIAVVGRKIPVKVFEPMFREEYEKRKEALEVFAAALAFYYEGDFAKAHDIFGTIAHLDAPASRYLARCEKLIESPPDNWDGVWTMTEK